MDQTKETPEFICLSTSYNTLTVTISESCFDATTDLCFRVKTEKEFNTLEYLIRNAIKANILLVYDPETGDRKTVNYHFTENQIEKWL